MAEELTPEQEKAKEDALAAAERIRKASGKEDDENTKVSKSATPEHPFMEDPNPGSHVKHVIGVVSGKGGVGKSFVTGAIANALRKQGHAVGILDADITGPSIPKMYGVHGPSYATEDGAYPVESAEGMKIMSINLLLDDDTQPVVWRGPVIANTVKQFWTDIIWGDLDYLLVDMPPGTGDVPLTVFQSLPIDGIVIVTSPQELVSMIVKKAYNMADMMKVPVLGVVENYSYVECPHCGEHISVFGESHIEETAEELSIDVLAKLPMNADYAAACDRGDCESIDSAPFAKAVQKLEAIS